MLVCMPAGALVLAGGAPNTSRLQHRESALKSACEAQNQSAQEALRKQQNPLSELVLPCDVRAIEEEMHIRPGEAGIRGEIVATHEALVASRAWPRPLEIVLGSVGIRPWLWYFLLRRISEIRAALAGNPPNG